MRGLCERSTRSKGHCPEQSGPRRCDRCSGKGWWTGYRRNDRCVYRWSGIRYAGCDGWIYFLCICPDRSKICPQVSDYIIASHVSKEPAAHLILKELDKEAIIHAGMCLGEGTGAVALFPLMDLSCAVYNSMSTFGDINVEQYEELK